jgi:hypothetical protein
MAFIILAVVIGLLCALLRYRALMMLAVSVLLAGDAVISGIILHAHSWMIAAEVLGSITALQFAFVALGLTLHFVRFRKTLPHIQAAIGQQLRAELEVPRDLPPDLSSLVERLQAARARFALSRGLSAN